MEANTVVNPRSKRMAPADMTWFSQEIAALEPEEECSGSLLSGLFANFAE